MAPLALLLVLAFFWLGYLVIERILVDHRRRAIPLRITVTGTRGKTTVTRLLAAVLGESGRTVLAKTTGSEAAYVQPDGTQTPVPRRGTPSIIEQKHLLRLAARLGADTLVAEAMSLHPENHSAEARHLLQPHLVLVTNFRVDHVDAQGRTPDAVAAVLALDVPTGARALVPEHEWRPAFARRVRQQGGFAEPVPAGAGTTILPSPGQFAGNLDLVFAAARSLGIDDATIQAGIRRASHDLGALRVWRYIRSDMHSTTLVVNAFAANDPESTLLIHDRVMREYDLGAGSCIGLLSLRRDRGDRTLQWVESLRAGSLARFRRLFVSGLHARAVKHRLRREPGADRIRILSPGGPEQMMDRMLGGEGDAPVCLFGFGNIGGLGETLVRHWRAVGESCGI